jgi:hypothetical protein
VLEQTLLSDPVYAVFLLAAAKLDDDFKKDLIPNEFGDVPSLSRVFGCLILRENIIEEVPLLSEVILPPFTKQAVNALLQHSSVVSL